MITVFVLFGILYNIKMALGFQPPAGTVLGVYVPKHVHCNAQRRPETQKPNYPETNNLQELRRGLTK